jgi:hypothetical protein
VKDLLSSVTVAKTYITSSLGIGNVLNIGVLKYLNVASQHCTEHSHLPEFITNDKTWERSLSPEIKNAVCDYMVKMKTEVTWRNKIF